ncbi:MAG: Polysaccharide deacetylase [Frankiales bacterium]|nr:Polysaccharide deacetylase [Frankiales bacterium]
MGRPTEVTALTGPTTRRGNGPRRVRPGPDLRRGRRTPATVLLYHGFGERSADEDANDLFLPTQNLRRHLRAFSRWYRPVSLTTYLDGLTTGRWPRRSVLITIDDGFRSTLTEAAQWFLHYQVPAVLFVPSGLLGRTAEWLPEFPDEPIVDGDDLRRLQAHGMEIGVHGFDHRSVAGMSREDLALNVVTARRRVADLLGQEPSAYAYPYGAFDGAAVAAVSAAGYAVAFAVEEGGNLMTTRRTVVNSYDSLPIVLLKALPLWDTAIRLLAATPRLRRALGRAVGRHPYSPAS